MLESPFKKLADLNTFYFIKKEAPAQVCSYEYCEVFKKSFFIEHLPLLLQNHGKYL